MWCHTDSPECLVLHHKQHGTFSQRKTGNTRVDGYLLYVAQYHTGTEQVYIMIRQVHARDRLDTQWYSCRDREVAFSTGKDILVGYHDRTVFPFK
jgi:hypothetical protein